MNLEQLKNIINDASFKNININCKFPKMNKDNISIFKKLINKFKDINQDDILDLFINNDINHFICKCGNFKHVKQNFCSKKCLCFKEYLRQKQKEGCLKKFGVENVFQNKEIIKKIVNKRINKTNEEKQIIANKKHQTKLNNVDENGLNSYQRGIIKQKESYLKKYNVDSYSKTQNFKDKIKNVYDNKTNEEKQKILFKREQTCLKKFGTENVFQNKEIIKKIVNKKNNKTKEEKKSIIQKRKQTKLEKYNDENYTNVEKAKQTSLKNNGYFGYFSSKEFKKRMKIWNSQQHITNINNLNEIFVKKNFIDGQYFLIEDFLQYFNLTRNVVEVYKQKFNIDLPNKRNNIKTQLEIYEFIKNNYDGVILLNNRKLIKNNEIDIYIPELKLAIEFDGLLFHSYGKSKHSMFNNYQTEDKFYHLNKTIKCQEQNIKLLHIFENEWYDKKNIWKSVILNHLGKNKRIYARKCVVKEVNEQDKRGFLVNNHLQGNCSSSINLGLFYDNKLVSLMTFGKSRFNKNFDWELLRFCTILNYTVIGGASKLLKYFKSIYNGNIISYANRRWSNGKLYEKLNFKLLDDTGVNYFYFTNDYILHNRLEFQKHKLKNKLNIFDDSLTESENMYNNGYRKIYDCGNLVYILE